MMASFLLKFQGTKIFAIILLDALIYSMMT